MTNAGMDRLAQVFVELADTLVADFDLIGFLHTLTDASVEVLNVQAAGLMLADQRGQLRSAAATGDIGYLEALELRNGEGPCLDCFNSEQPVTNIAPDEARRRWPTFTANAEQAGYLAVHAVPLRLRGEVVGAVNLYCSEQRTLSAEALNVAQALADVATIGLLQERIIRDKTVLTEQLQSALNSRVLIEQAKGVIAERRNILPSEAFTVLRTYARDRGHALVAVASAVVSGQLDPTTTTEAAN